MADAGYEGAKARFYEEFPTPDLRLRAAKELAKPKGGLPDASHLGHNVLVVLWNEGTQGWNKFATRMYGWHPLVAAKEGQAVMVFPKLEEGDQPNKHLEDPSLPLDIELGVVQRNESLGAVAYSFGGSNERSLSRMDVSPPWLWCGVGIKTSPLSQSLEITIGGRARLKDITSSRSKTGLVVCEATVPLDDGPPQPDGSPSRYEAERKIAYHPVLLGNEAVTQAVVKLAVRSGMSRSEFAKAGLDPDAPLEAMPRLFAA